MEVPTSKSCKNIEKAFVYKAAPERRVVLIAISVVLYAVVLQYVWSTSGEPLRRAILEVEALENKRLLEEEIELEQQDEVVLSWGEEDEEGVSVKSSDDADLVLDQDSGDQAAVEDEKKVEEKAKKKKKKKKKNSTNLLDDFGLDDEEEEEEEERPLPNWWLPDAGAAASLFILLSGTALFNLLCHWFVWFKAWAYMTPSKVGPQPGAFVHVVPYAYRGKAELCQVKMDAKSGNLVFEFQRQKFELLKEGVDIAQVKLMGLSSQDGAKDHEDEDVVIKNLSAAELERCQKLTQSKLDSLGVFSPVVARVNLPVGDYLSSRGLGSARMVEDTKARFGVNSLQIKSKTMPELVKEGMLSPLAMFQFFSAALWLMDEYWQFTIFNLFSIVMMEAMTAFQRFRTLSTLKGLAPKPYELPVYREGRWFSVKTTDLLPGDLISLTSAAHTVSTGTSVATGKSEQPQQQQPQQAKKTNAKSGSDAVPCDCLILHGSAVVNEATLTGESVPQMKDALRTTSHSDKSVQLDLQGRDRVHVMFSGTTLISATQGEESDKSFPKAPDGGCLCYVLRTGFGSSQGELMQMIEFSTEQVSADSRETGLALLVLLFFAIVSAGYVFTKGMEKGDRTTHELLLKCIIILTSVVPRQLPVQMALAVNHALMTLLKQGLFCTEPYRVPYAGKITHCLFDKTGTLTTDELVPVGVVNNDAAAERASIKHNEASASVKDLLVGVPDASDNAVMVLAACHTLVAMPQQPGQPKAKGSQLLGDPIELAAMKGVKWGFDPKTQLATPGDYETVNDALITVTAKLEMERSKPEKTPALKASILDLMATQEKLVAARKAAMKHKDDSTIQAIQIMHRFHFSSKLQRMSVICRVKRKGCKSSFSPQPMCLVKGSPEAVGKLLLEGAEPSWYRSVYRQLAEQGMRVLALGVRKLEAGVECNTLVRDEAEKDLEFAGFIAFECKTRGDSGVVIQSLRESDHRVAMLTGDSPLTALHVARTTNICTGKSGESALLLQESPKLEWVGAIGPEEKCQRVPFSTNGIPALAEKHDLLTTEAALLAAVEESKGEVWNHVECIAVFARMSPQGKAKVIRMIQQNGSSAQSNAQQTKFVMMVGDGGNDVGALKQADVGLALLGGYGNANTTVEEGAGDGQQKVVDAEDALNQQENALKIKQRAAQKKFKAEFDAKKKAIMARQKDMIAEAVAAAEARGETGLWTQVNAAKAVAIKVRDEIKREQELLQRKHLSQLQPKGDQDDPTALALEALEDPNALPVVRPGDASVAAPFTSRVPSVRSAVQLIRQGRCTLLSALQQQSIMCLESVISAYCLAALSLEGARSSERQMMASSWLIMTASLAFSYSTPIDKMHPIRPIRSLFHPAIAVSILGQAAIHLFCMVTAVNMAKEAMGEEKLAEVVAFNRRVARGLEKQLDAAESSDEGLDYMANVLMVWQAPFKVNLLNTCIFLVETSQIMAVLFVNYKGRPWMLGMVENHALFLSLFLCIGALVFATFEVSPQLNRLIHLHEFPDNAFRFQIIGLVLTTLFGTLIWDRVVTAIFAPKIAKAQLEQALQTTPMDLVPIFKTLAKVGGGFLLLATGNPLIWFGAYWAYRKYNASKEAEEELQVASK